MTDTELLTQISESTTAACAEMQEAHADLLEAMKGLVELEASATSAKTDAALAKAEAETAKADASAAKTKADAAKAAIEDEATGLAAIKQAAAQARTTATEAKTLAEAALPKAGGTMTGPLLLAETAAAAYDASAVSAKWVRDNALFKSGIAEEGLEFCVGSGANASDTADLYAGRGSREKPFASLRGAVSFAKVQYSGVGSITFRLLSDITLDDGDALYMPLDFISKIISDDAENPATITVTKHFAFGSGNWVLGTLKIHGLETAQNLIFCSGFSRWSRVLLSGNIEFSGKAAQAVIGSYWGGRVNIYPGITLSGNPIGKKYMIDQMSQLFSAGVTIPGTLAGECKTGSVFA